MATRRWCGRAGAVPQVQTATPSGAIATSDVYKLTIDTRVVSASPLVATAVGVVTALQAALSAATYPEFQKLTVTTNSTGDVLIFTGPATGEPFTLTVAVTGAGTFGTAVTTSPTGPNWWTNINNWLEGIVPIAGVDVIINEGPSILYGLDQSAVTLASLSVLEGFLATSTIGLPRNTQPSNPDAGYPEYLDQYLKISATVATIRTPSKRVRIDFGANQTSLTIDQTGSPDNDGEKALDVLGVHAANVMRINKGNAGVAFPAGSVSTFLTVTSAYRDQVDGDVDLVMGDGLTLTNFTQTGGNCTLRCAVTTVDRRAGSLTRYGAGAITTLNNRGGKMADYGTGTITTFNQGAGYRRRGLAALTVTNCNIYPGSEGIDAAGVIVWTNPVQYVECSPPGAQGDSTAARATFDFGRNRKIAITY